ncbi:hypothetical protein DdX_12578 [Ditylenchus destructor]|uniref:C-type lectin domain-containing protein n=1 Tax=Ditylenchus destructor TaxID=166010 RepID=A0AAD4R3J7_9BILA|nr:hypothetical protein DdX_12578 [Ditylenchus destructor]
MVFLFIFATFLLKLTEIAAETSETAPPTKPTRYSVECPPLHIDVGIYQRCLKYEPVALDYDAAHKKCLKDGGALAAAAPGMSGLDKMEAEVKQHQAQSNSSEYSAWIVREHPPEGESAWDPHCLTFKDGVQKCDGSSHEKLPYFCERYKYSPCGEQEGWSFRDNTCYKVIIGKKPILVNDFVDLSHAATILCRDIGTFDEDGWSDTYLAKVDSRSKNELVIDMLEKAGVKNAWIGLDMNREVTGDHEWYGHWMNKASEGFTDESYLSQEEQHGRYPWAPDEPQGSDLGSASVFFSRNVYLSKIDGQWLWKVSQIFEKLEAVVCSRPFTIKPVGPKNLR